MVYAHVHQTHPADKCFSLGRNGFRFCEMGILSHPPELPHHHPLAGEDQVDDLVVSEPGQR
jgi:hypothetical protein